ncbi:MAG: hypothetical protein ACYDCM_09600 [Candidatus Acidiferrales bacterium]
MSNKESSYTHYVILNELILSAGVLRALNLFKPASGDRRRTGS